MIAIENYRRCFLWSDSSYVQLMSSSLKVTERHQVCAAHLVLTWPRSGSSAKELSKLVPGQLLTPGCFPELVSGNACPQECSRYTALQHHMHHHQGTDPSPIDVWSPWVAACCRMSTIAIRTIPSLFQSKFSAGITGVTEVRNWHMWYWLQPAACSCCRTTALW